MTAPGAFLGKSAKPGNAVVSRRDELTAGGLDLEGVTKAPACREEAQASC